MAPDETDKKILNVIIENSRLSLRQIAKKVGVSVATVMHHLQNLEKEKIIRNYTSQIDYEKIGYDIEVLIEIRISKGRLLDVEKKIAVHPNVFAVYDITGSFDAAILARFETRRKMDNFLKKIQTYEFVERTETKLILKTIKEGNILIE
ncbi:MAG TPA: Lrp/AsnC family transcriptional regulator [Candidatus Nanoarchaeia archaeon]|nr:Lrp/AsnC family transcriptional regulator [Candidatus Nanoarchaeia archaeon]